MLRRSCCAGVWQRAVLFVLFVVFVLSVVFVVSSARCASSAAIWGYWESAAIWGYWECGAGFAQAAVPPSEKSLFDSLVGTQCRLQKRAPPLRAAQNF